MERYTMFLEGKNQYCENDYTTQSNLQIQCNLYKLTNGIFHSTRTKNFTIHTETQKTPYRQRDLSKEEWSWRNQSSWFQTILQSCTHQDSMQLAEKQKYRLMEQDRNPEKSPHTYGHLIFDKVGKTMWKWKWKLLRCVQLFATPGTIQYMEFYRPEYWSG